MLAGQGSRLSHISQDAGTSIMPFAPPTPTGSFRDEEPISRPSSPTPWAHSLRYTIKQPSYHEVSSL